MAGVESRWESSVLLAELTVRHTRRHMPTRRVALDHAYLPMTGARHGSLLIQTVIAENLAALDEEQLELLPRLLDDARRGLSIPRIALRYRLQTDVHGLDRSRHRVLGEDGRIIVELDVHGAPVPQVLGTVIAAASMLPQSRDSAIQAIRLVLARRYRFPDGVLLRRLEFGVPQAAPPPPGTHWDRSRPPQEAEWAGVPSERRWAMEVLGLRAAMPIDRDDINRRFRRLLRDAHPDHGGARAEAAERIAELSAARDLLLDVVAASAVPAAGD
jgi:hypothetical protein